MRSAASSRLVTGCLFSRATRSAMLSFILPMRGDGVDISEVSVRTRAGWRMLSTCAIIPPSDPPSNMRRIPAQRVEDRDGIVGHRVERVGGDGRGAREHLQHARRRGGGHVRRQPDVAVVEPRYHEATLHERPAEIDVPLEHLHPDAHNQQQRLIGVRPERFIGDRHAVGAGPGKRYPWRCVHGSLVSGLR